jgi:electron transport complex protein RnfE
MHRSTAGADFARGIFRENPIFITLLGLCPSLAITDRVSKALGMSAAVFLVLLGTNFLVSLVREHVSERWRIPVFVTIIGSLATVVNLVMQTYTPVLYHSLGIYAQLIAVNCIILGRADSFARSNRVGRSVLDAIGMGIGFTLSLLLLALIREVLGHGTITLFPLGSFSGVIKIPGLSDSPIRVVGLAAGAFLVFGYLKAFFNFVAARNGNGEKERAGQAA